MALANVDYDMHNRHHLSYNFMMVHSNVQSVGNYEGKDATFSDDYGNLGMTRRQQVNESVISQPDHDELGIDRPAER